MFNKDNYSLISLVFILLYYRAKDVGFKHQTLCFKNIFDDV